jgi:hypothetical protein
MKGFLMLVAVAAIAGAMYVAAAPGGLRAAPSPAKLQREIKALQKQVKAAKNEADAGLGVSLLCIMHQPVGVDQVGNATSGYLFGPPQTAPTAVTAVTSSALDLAPSTETSPQHNVYELNTSQSACVQLAKEASTLTAERAVAVYASSH